MMTRGIRAAVHRRGPPQKKTYVPIPGTRDYFTLHGKKDFADVIQDFVMKGLSWITRRQRRAQCNHKSPYK